MYCGGTLNRVPVIVLMLSRLVLSMSYRSTCGREHDARREMPLDSDRRDESRAVQSRVPVGIGDVGIGVHLALGDRRLADLLDRARRERCLVVAEVGARSCQRDGAIDRENQVGRVIGDLRGDAALDPNAEDRPVAVDNGDDGAVDIHGGRGAFQQGLYVLALSTIDRRWRGGAGVWQG